MIDITFDFRSDTPAHVIDQIPEAEREEFVRITYTIGGMIVFPANQIDQQANDQRCPWN